MDLPVKARVIGVIHGKNALSIHGHVKLAKRCKAGQTTVLGSTPVTVTFLDRGSTPPQSKYALLAILLSCLA